MKYMNQSAKYLELHDRNKRGRAQYLGCLLPHQVDAFLADYKRENPGATVDIKPATYYHVRKEESYSLPV